MDFIGSYSELKTKGTDLNKIINGDENDEKEKMEEDVKVSWTAKNMQVDSVKNVEVHQPARRCTSDDSSNARRQTIVKYVQRQTRRRTIASSNSKRIKSMHEV